MLPEVLNDYVDDVADRQGGARRLRGRGLRLRCRCGPRQQGPHPPEAPRLGIRSFQRSRMRGPAARRPRQGPIASPASSTVLAPCPRLVVNDATVEKLGELLNENPNGLLLIRDELPGWLAKMESDEYQSDRAFYLEAFNGDGRFTYDRIGRGTIAIENCTLSIIGGIQPSRLAPLVRGAVSGHLQRWADPALSARCLAGRSRLVDLGRPQSGRCGQGRV